MKKRDNQWQKGKARLLTFLLLGAIISFSNIYAQQQNITGKVTDNRGDELIGVTVAISGTTTGVLTNVMGEYTISAPVGSELTFSFIGYETQVIEVGNQGRIDVELKENVVDLEGVTVTALGIQRANRDIGYAVQTVSGDEFKKSPSPNAINSLVGRVAGLTVSPSPELLKGTGLVLRGSSDVLMVVDGVPVNTDGFALNPNDIASYTVLKGPNAASLYGFRGQNGAILITTKRASEERVSVELNSSTMFDAGYVSITSVQEEYGLGTNYRYAFGNDPIDRDGSFTRTLVWGPRFEGQPVPQWNSPVDPETGIRTGTPWVSHKDNFKDFLEPGYITNNNISVATNYDRFNSRISLGHTYQDYMMPNTSMNIYNASISTGYNVSRRLRVEGNLSYSKQYSPNVPEVEYGPNSYAYQFGIYVPTHVDMDDMKDYWMPGMEGVQQRSYEYGRANNPYFMAYEWTREHHKSDIHGFVKVDYELSPEINISLRTQITSWDFFRDEKVPYSANKYGREAEKAGDYIEDRRSLFDNNTDLLITYNTQLSPDFRLSALAGGNIRKFDYNASWMSTDFLVVPGVYNFSNSLNPIKGYNYKSEMVVYSGYGNVDLAFRNFATLSASGRVDQLSTLPDGNNTFFYPSVTLASMVSDYLEMPSFISTLKPRASYANVKGGLTRSTIGAAYTIFESRHPVSNRGHDYNPSTAYNGPSYENQDAYATSILYELDPSVSLSSTMANPSLQPYSVDSYEGGLELGLFNNRVYVDFTYFMMYNGPQIFAKTAAPSTGFHNEMINGIKTKKDGYEVALTMVPLAVPNGLRWQLGMNLGTYKEVLHEGLDGEGVNIRGINFEVGDRLDAIYGTKFNRTEDDRIMHDANGMPLFSPRGVGHLKKIGYGNPDFVWGVHNSVTYQNWSLGFQLDGRVGGIFHSDVYGRSFQGGSANELAEGAYGEARLAEWNHFKETGAIVGKYVADGVKLVSGTPRFENGFITNMDELVFAENDMPVRLQTYAGNVYSNIQEKFALSKTYIMLRDVSVSYSVPDRILAGRVSSATISLIGKNLFYSAKHEDKFQGVNMDEYGEGFDAAKNSLTFRQSTQRAQSPTARQIGLNLNIVF